jgi:Transmembrane secretion effector
VRWFAELIAPSRLGRSFRWLLASSWVTNLGDGITLAAGPTATLLPMLVDKPDLGIANSRAMTGIVVWNQLAGPPVGAALFAVGMALPFVSESDSWFALIVFVIFGAHAFVWGTTSTSVRQRAVPAEFQGRVSSVYLTGVVGGILIGSALGGVVASACGITAPFWFAFAGSAIMLAVIWRSLLHIAHSDEHARASEPAASA